MQKPDRNSTEGACKRCRGAGGISLITIELPIECGVIAIILKRAGRDRGWSQKPARVVHGLLLLADGGLVIQITQQELADRIGLGRVSVSRALRELEREGIISVHRGRIEIEDLERLRDLALF
jgi:CRP-like cAMP-binding protein